MKIIVYKIDKFQNLYSPFIVHATVKMQQGSSTYQMIHIVSIQVYSRGI